MKSIFALALLTIALAAGAECPFSLRSSNLPRYRGGVRLLDLPGSVAAQDQAANDLLGIKHYLVFLRPEQAPGSSYLLKIVQLESGTEKVLEQVEVKNANDPKGGVGISVLPSASSVRIKIYTSSHEALHEVSSAKLGKFESSTGDDGVLPRYMIDDKPILKLVWSKVEEK